MAKKVMGWKTPKGNRKVETSKPAMAKKETKPATKPTVKRVSKPKRSKFAMSQDAKIKAKKPGWRTAANGNEYYEARPNRSDENRKKKPFLQKGGPVEEVVKGEWYNIYDPGMDTWNEWEYIGYTPGYHTFREEAPMGNGTEIKLNDNDLKNHFEEKLIKNSYRKGGGVGKVTARPYVQYEYFNTPDMDGGFYVVALGDKVVWLANDVDAIEEWCKEEEYRIGSRDGIYNTKKPKGAKEWDVERFETLDSNGYGEDESPYSGYVLFRKGVPHYVGFSEDEFEDIISGNYAKGGGVGDVSFSPVAVEEATLPDLFEMADEIGLTNYQNLNKEVLRKRILQKFNVKLKDGGTTYAKEDKEMLHSQNKSVRHHSMEMENVIDKQKHIEPWVVAKMSRATNDMSDLTHYLDGNKKRRGGGVGDVDSNIHIVWDTTQKITDDIRSFIFDSYEAAGEELADDVIAAIEQGIELAKMDMR